LDLEIQAVPIAISEPSQYTIGTVLKHRVETVSWFVISQSRVVNEVVGGETFVTGEVSCRSGRLDSEAALDVSTGQIATEEGFDLYIEQPLPLGL
jgi:hypothetical protein